MRIVTDASIGVKWFSYKNEDNVDLALEIRNKQFQNKIEIIVPDLFFFEIMNALFKKKGFTGDIVHLSFETLYCMNLNIIYPGKEIINIAIDISDKTKLTFYDSLYIAVAIGEEALLLTEDREILQNKNIYDFIKSLDEVSVL